MFFSLDLQLNNCGIKEMYNVYTNTSKQWVGETERDLVSLQKTENGKKVMFSDVLEEVKFI